jgi:hypothetical protein
MDGLFRTFEYWSDKCGGSFQLDSEPFEGKPVTTRSTFLYSSSSSPMTPCCSSYSGWYHLPTPVALAGYLRFLLLPVYFAWYIDRDQWSEDGDTMVTVEDMLTEFRSTDDFWGEEAIQPIEEIIAMLDSAMSCKTDSDCFKTIKDVATVFNGYWAEGGGWNFEIKVYDNPVEVGEILADNFDWDDDDDFDEDETEELDDDEAQRIAVRAICEKAATDREKGEIFLDALRSTHP